MAYNHTHTISKGGAFLFHGEEGSVFYDEIWEEQKSRLDIGRFVMNDLLL